MTIAQFRFTALVVKRLTQYATGASDYYYYHYWNLPFSYGKRLKYDSWIGNIFKVTSGLFFCKWRANDCHYLILSLESMKKAKVITLSASAPSKSVSRTIPFASFLFEPVGRVVAKSVNKGYIPPPPPQLHHAPLFCFALTRCLNKNNPPGSYKFTTKHNGQNLLLE